MKYYSRLILAFGTGLFFLFSPVQAQAPDFTPTTAGEITDSVTENSLSSVILSEQGESNGGPEGTRTPDPFHAMEVLYQLSYWPVMPYIIYNDEKLSKIREKITTR